MPAVAGEQHDFAHLRAKRGEWRQWIFGLERRLTQNKMARLSTVVEALGNLDIACTAVPTFAVYVRVMIRAGLCLCLLYTSDAADE